MPPHDRPSDACVRFRLGDQGFGLPLGQVREIAAAGRVTAVPMAPPVIRGLANLRGRVVTLIDVASIYGRPLPPARFPEDRLALLLAGPWEHLGLYVHAPVEIGRHAAAQEMSAETMALAASASGGDGARAPAPRVAAVTDDVVHLISAAEIVAFCEARVLEGFRRRS